jgi:hypothetical protein
MKTLFFVIFCAASVMPWKLAQADGRFGVSTGFGRLTEAQDPVLLIPMIKELGAGWIRDGIPIAEVDGANLGNNWTPQRNLVFPAHDLVWIRLATQNNLKVVLCLSQWSVPDEVARVAAFVTQTLMADPTLASVKAIEVLNEPDIQTVGGKAFYQYYGGSRNYASPEPAWEAEYAAIANATYKSVKAVNPAMLVIGGGASVPSTFCEIQNGMPLDGYTNHPYSTGLYLELTPNNSNALAGDGIATADAAGTYSSQVQMLQAWARKYGVPPSIWETEWGQTNGIWNGGENSQAQCGIWAMRRLIMSLALGVTHTFMYTAIDEPGQPSGDAGYTNYGFINQNGNKKQIYYYIQRVIDIVSGIPASHHAVTSSPAIDRAYGFDTADGSYSVIGFWNAGWSSDQGPSQQTTLTITHPNPQKVVLYDPVENTSTDVAGWKWTGTGLSVNVSATTYPQFIIVK